ncbi:MAG: hypothetical protein H7Y27_01000 [Gemmatimonadaceae bacterium]|nr:hypothetical protein [Chitinophagaceae bacterium]
MLNIREWFPYIFRKLRSAETYRNMARAAWLFFPAILFILLTYMAFWKITQGRDLILFTLQKPNAFVFLILTQMFWAYMIWYSSRLVSTAKCWESPGYFYEKVRTHFPRFLGFTCFTITNLAILQIPFFSVSVSPGTAHILLLLSFFYYLLVDHAWNLLVNRNGGHTHKLMIVALIVLVVSTGVVVFFRSASALMLLFLEMQIFYVLFIIGRRKEIELKNHGQVPKHSQDFDYGNATGIRLQYRKLKRLFFDRDDKNYFIAFNIIGIGVFIVYIVALSSVKFSLFLGTVPVVLMAFGILVGFSNFISTNSVFAKFNFHIILLILAFGMGSFKEQYHVSLPQKAVKDAKHSFSNRQSLPEYFTYWLQQRDSLIKKSGKFPVYIVMANGGASRSGYWAASVLGQLEDENKTAFSDHLLCMSGASGGSVGNASFFSLLMNKDRVPLKGDSSYRSAVQDYLQSDFLSHTLVYMLGPDYFQHMIPIIQLKNREDALVASLEKSPADSAFLYNKLDTCFSSMMSKKNDSNYRLPVLFVNTTRMQDGRPAVISNILIDSVFNKRVDVLSLVNNELDMKLSTSVVLGASFPYLSPAGRIDQTLPNGNVKPHYFVDGGYFDNSGAGVVNEMLIGIRKIMNDPRNAVLFSYKDMVEFYVLHITNDPVGEPVLDTVNSLVNDLAAPLKTLSGSYGTQTVVNDYRLEKYLAEWYSDGKHYIPFNLYKPREKSSKYSMNWVISPPVLTAMRARLNDNDIRQKINTVVLRMQQ